MIRQEPERTDPVIQSAVTCGPLQLEVLMSRSVLLPLFVVLLAAFASVPVTIAGDASVYGDGVGKAEIVKVSELLSHPGDYVGKHVRVEGLITDVCPKRGCWVELASDREFETIRIKVEDGVIVFPMDAKGKRAEAEGIFTKIEVSPEQALAHAKHLAEESGVEFDPDNPGELPTVIYQIQGTGAVVR